jgi:crossover junction endodeoxyribonuclease RusA
MMIRFEVLGTPTPKGSMRAVARFGRAFVVPGGDSETRKRLATWDQNVREGAAIACRAAGFDLETPAFVDGPVRVLLTFRLRRPKGHWNKTGLSPKAPLYPAVKPDVDKLERAVLDALTGVAFADDAQVCEVIKNKVYAYPGEEGATITIESMAGET